jgi:hypothetical protein
MNPDQDLAAIRSMMERSSRFLSLSGFSGVLAGLYALVGAYLASEWLGFRPDAFAYETPHARELAILAGAVLALALSTAMWFSARDEAAKGRRVWTATTRLLMTRLLLPVAVGGAAILIAAWQGYLGLAVPLTLIFYGLALFSASVFTIPEIAGLGLTQTVLGLAALAWISFSIEIWALGFGAAHILYGAYIHHRYRRA